jgi:hypothetical protein
LAADPFPFEVLEVLGEGAFGAVCVARMTNDPLQRHVAIKVLKAEYAKNPKVLHRTRDEARLLSRLHHPNVVAVEQLIEVHDRPILVMELVRGLDVKTLLKRSPYGIPASVAMEIVRQTCIALHDAYYEAKGEDGKPLRVIHRDIKPSNILLSVHGQLKVVDFGVATGQFRGREARTDSIVMGSRPYMAPERLDRTPDTPAVDIYSLGMSLHEVLTGHVMPLSVNAATHDRSMDDHLVKLTPVGLGATATEDLRRLIRRMCAYDADLRPTARDTAAELARLIDGMDPAHRITLEEFAKDVVQPLYKERRRVPLKVAIGQLEDRELLTGAIGGLGAPGTASAPRRRPPAEFRKQPAIFLGVVFGLVTAFGGLAVNKMRSEGLAGNPGALGMARVKLWFPRDARARVGSLGLAVPGHLDLPAGPHQLDLVFEDGRRLSCSLDVRQEMAVRFVVERGEGGVSIDDGPVVRCRDAQ